MCVASIALLSPVFRQIGGLFERHGVVVDDFELRAAGPAVDDLADLDVVDERYAERADVLIESHLAHRLDGLDVVVVLRCAPATLEVRLRERDDGTDREAPAREDAGPAEPPRALTREARGKL